MVDVIVVVAGNHGEVRGLNGDHHWLVVGSDHQEGTYDRLTLQEHVLPTSPFLPLLVISVAVLFSCPAHYVDP